MITIWKYALNLTDLQGINMPAGAQVLSVQFQRGQLYMWVLVNPEIEAECHVFSVFGTGHSIPIANRQYIATVQDGMFVWHVFEELGQEFPQEAITP